MRYGRMALYTPGDAKNAKHFASMHAVQRHMVDRGLCRMAYDDNEDEYADFYDFDKLDEDAAGAPNWQQEAGWRACLLLLHVMCVRLHDVRPAAALTGSVSSASLHPVPFAWNLAHNASRQDSALAALCSSI